jgi:hypothetical protein
VSVYTSYEMKKFLPWILAGVFLIVGIATIHDYGINWDTPQRLMRGQAYDYYILTGSLRYPGGPDGRTSPLLFVPGEFATRINFLSGEQLKPAVLPVRPLLYTEYEASGELSRRESFYKHYAWDPYYYRDGEEPGHPPLPENIATVFNHVLWGKLALLGDIESYDVFFILVSAFGIYIVTLFALEITGSILAATIAGFSMALYPIFFAESHFNLKDPLQAAMFAASVWALWHWVKTSRLRWCIAFVGFVMLALGIKWNIGFLPFIVIPWFISIRKEEAFKQWFNIKKLLCIAAISFVVIAVFLVAIWPSAWPNPVRWLEWIPQFYVDTGTGTDNIQPAGFILAGGWNVFVILSYLIQTPVVILVLAGVGIYRVLRKENTVGLRPGVLLTCWCMVPLLRTVIPGMRNYSGLRQIMEIVPATALLAGIGMDYLIRITHGVIQKLIKIILFISFIVLIGTLIRLHPNENLYFNTFIGGIPGAAKHNMIDTMISYGNVYKQAVAWLNTNVSANANVAILEGYDFALSPLWLRPDISISPYHFSGLDRRGEYIFVIRHHNAQPNFARMYAQTFLTPAYEVKVDNVAFLTVYQNSNYYVKKGFEKELEDTHVQARTIPYPGGTFTDINLGSNRRVTRITIAHTSPACTYKNNFAIIDETVSFFPEDANHRLQQTTIADHLYSLQERKKLGNGDVEYYFPAERASLIRIIPKSKYSCFIGSTIVSVHYIAE